MSVNSRISKTINNYYCNSIEFDGGFNIYLYIGANPIVRVDESGEYWWFIRGGVYVVSKLYKIYKKLSCLVYELIDCNYKMIYIGISKTPWLRIYAHRSRQLQVNMDVDDKCEVNMLIIRGFKKEVSVEDIKDI